MRTAPFLLLCWLLATALPGWQGPATAQAAPVAEPPPAGGAAPAPGAPAARPDPATRPAPESAPPPGDRPAGDPPGGARPAAADGAAPGPTPADMTPPLKKKNLSHRFQVGLEVGVGAGYSFLITYRDTTWCGQLDGADNASFCSGLHPAFLDFGLSFGMVDKLDLIVDFRLGLMDDPTHNRPLMLMPGVRVWIDPDQPFKIGIGFQLVVDLTKQNAAEQIVYGRPVKGVSTDFGGRIFGQFQYDFARYVGIYAKIGASITARRWIQVNLAGQLGVQTRFP